MTALDRTLELVMENIDNVGEDLSKLDWIDLLGDIEDECASRRETAEIEIENEDDDEEEADE